MDLLVNFYLDGFVISADIILATYWSECYILMVYTVITIFDINVRNFNVLLTTDVVSFEQLGSVWHVL